MTCDLLFVICDSFEDWLNDMPPSRRRITGSQMKIANQT